MKNLTKEQIEKINEVFDSINGEGLTEEDIIQMYGIDNVEFVESAEDSANENESFEDISVEDKIEEIWQYYDCAGFDFKTERTFGDFWEYKL